MLLQVLVIPKFSAVFISCSAGKLVQNGVFIAQQSCIVFNCIFIFLSQESDQSAITSSLRSCQPSVYHTKIGKLACKCVRYFPNKLLQSTILVLRN